MCISESLAKIDAACDYIPLVSTLTNLIDLFIKFVLPYFVSQDAIRLNHYYRHLEKKSFSRCFLLAIPFVGNMLIAGRAF